MKITNKRGQYEAMSRIPLSHDQFMEAAEVGSIFYNYLMGYPFKTMSDLENPDLNLPHNPVTDPLPLDKVPQDCPWWCTDAGMYTPYKMTPRGLVPPKLRVRPAFLKGKKHILPFVAPLIDINPGHYLEWKQASIQRRPGGRGQGMHWVHKCKTPGCSIEITHGLYCPACLKRRKQIQRILRGLPKQG